MPNIKWLPSRSVNRREEHEQFYNRIWPKDDPFWDHNQPGNLWNCKCDWQQTDEPPTDNNPTSRIQHKGLDGNPAKTGQIFSDEASYIKRSTPDTETYCRKTVFKEQKKWAFENLKGESVTNKDSGLTIYFSKRGISEFLNQPSDFYYEKNAMIFSIDKILSDSEYIRKTNHKNHESVIFKIRNTKKRLYLICNYNNERKLWFYSITDSENVAK